MSEGNPVESFGALPEFGPFEVEERGLYAAFKRWSEEAGTRPIKEREFRTALERMASKQKRLVERVRLLSSYVHSSWIDPKQNRTLVYPALADAKSWPYGYRGARLAEGHFGAPIGCEIPESSSVRQDFV